MTTQSSIHAASGIDPVARARRTTIVVGAVCGVLVGLAVTWCCWPLGAEDGDPSADSTLTAAVASTPQTAPSLNLAGFEAPLWTAPPPRAVATVPAAPPPPLPPLRLQLLGIFQVGGGTGEAAHAGDAVASYRALLYDPDQDKVVIVASGDSIAQRRVDSVDKNAVALRDTGGVRTLALRPDQPLISPAPEVRR